MEMQTTVDAGLSVRLLGELELRLGDRPLPALESARAESLLAYLLIHRDAPQPRQRIAFLLWPDSGEAQARTNLRHVLHKLRRSLPAADRYLDVTTRTLRWRPEAPARVDFAEFEAALDRADTAADPVDDLEAAVAAYGSRSATASATAWRRRSTASRRCSSSGAITRGPWSTPSGCCASIPYARRHTGC